jgi:AraC-like DNA-binding protein
VNPTAQHVVIDQDDQWCANDRFSIAASVKFPPGPQRYVMQRRLERAKRLLRQSHRPIALIARSWLL